MKRATIRLIVIIGTISIIGIVIIQIYWIHKTFSIKEKQFNQSVTIALRNVAQILFDYNNDLYEETCGTLNEDPVEKLSADYYVVNVNCIIDADILEHYLTKELEEKNVKIDFEYGIYDCSSDEMVYGNYITYNRTTGDDVHSDGLMVSYVTSNETYEGAGDGAIDLVVSGGKPPYIYMWSDGTTTEDVNNLSSGIHVVTITDNDNCLVVDSIMVFDNSEYADTMVTENTNLHKYDKFTYYFGVYFPTRPNFIAAGMKMWYLFSAIMLIVIVFFAYSLIIILKQRRLTEVQNDFINNMTHEFKTPLSSISISADVLNDQKIIQEPERMMKYARIIKEQNVRLQSHVENVLKMASIDKNKIKLNRVEFVLTDFVREVISDFKLSLGSKGDILVDTYLETETIYADTLHFSNVLLNILDNAFKYSVKKPVIQISIKKNKKSIELKIKDNGIGMKKEHVKRIFQKFYRVPTGDIHNVKGFGLGLNYVYNIIKAHKWKIEVTSIVDEGTCFNIIIPNSKQNI